MLRSTVSAALIAASLVPLAACGQLRDELGRAESSYDEARYEDAIVWLDELEHDISRLDQPDRARFYYLRGMTALRLERRDEALHYLVLAREEAGESHAGLQDPWKETLRQSLEELTPAGATHHARSSPDPS